MQNAVPKHYLWAVGEGIKACQPGELIAGRYLLKRDRIVQDTQPEELPEMPEDLPGSIAPYLRLFPHRLHVPQVYGQIPRSASKLTAEIWLLEEGPISVPSENLMPELASAWKKAPAMRQLNWLWQLAGLWQPLSAQGVASTLVNPQLLRVEGPLLRLLELQADRKPATLSQLGQLWQQWMPEAHPTIASFLRQLCQQMVAGELRSSEQLTGQLDQALAICGRRQKRTIAIATGTDTGPTRTQNEDACYPISGTNLTVTPGAEAFSIVCDGIGGQDGGEVASELAITVLRDCIEQMLLHPANWDPLSLTGKLERSAKAANDAIASRNDSEHRQGRQRMGTTLVMGLAHIHELYITHVGDSRAYWITRTGCYQVTVDDDVASREVRLGYALYREALHQVAAGALVQALGITSSATLHPTVQRFPIDEDCVFLLCSDGLSDRDRVEEYWETEILPLLDGKVDLYRVRDRLIQIANTKNGHDNVTVALLHFQVVSKEDATATELSVAPVVALPADQEPHPEATEYRGQTPDADSSLKTELLPRPKVPSLLPLLLKILFLLGVGGVLAYFFIPPAGRWMDSVKEWMLTQSGLTGKTKAPPASPTPTPTPTPSLTSPTSSSLTEGALIEIQSGTAGDGGGQSDRLRLYLKPETSAPVTGTVTVGSFLQVKKKQTAASEGTWLYVQVCSTPQHSGETLSKVDSQTLKPLQPGEAGWVLEANARWMVVTPSTPNPTPLGKCGESEATTLTK